MKHRAKGQSPPPEIDTSTMMGQHTKNVYSKKRGGGLPTTGTVLYMSIFLNIFLVLALLYLTIAQANESSASAFNLRSPGGLIGKEMTWHGGHPAQDRPGQCWCGADTYCMCTPSLAIDLIIASGPDHVWLVRRKDTNQLATMGGFVDVGENAESAVKRELMEEMGVDLMAHQIKLFGVYSDPRRDNRRHTVSAVFAVHLDADIHPHAADDVKDVQRIPLSEIEANEYFADHKTILMDYKRAVSAETKSQADGDFATDVARSTCHKA